MNSPEILCRICLDSSSVEKNNFAQVAAACGDLTWGDAFAECTGIDYRATFPENHELFLPQTICKMCSEVLATAYVFRKRCHKSNDWLLQKLLLNKIRGNFDIFMSSD